MADFRINVIVDPQRARPGIDEVRAELDSLDAAGGRLNQNLGNLARDLDIPVDSVSNITNELTDGFELATEATEALEAANDSVIGSVVDTAEAVGDVSDAAQDLVEKGDGLDDLRARMEALTDRADDLGDSFGDAGGAANDAVSGLGRSSGVIRGLAIGLGVVAAAVIAVGIGALVTQDRTREAFGDLGTDILDLGRAVVAGIREVLGPVDDFIVSTVEAASRGIQGLRDDVLELAGVQGFLTTKQLEYNEAFAVAAELGEDFGEGAIDGLARFRSSLLDAKEAIGLTSSELIGLRSAVFVTDARIALVDEFADAIENVNDELQKEKIDANQAAAQLAALEQEQIKSLEAFDESIIAINRYTAELALATEQQERLDDALSTFASLASDQTLFDQQIEDLLFLRDTGEITMDQFVDATLEALSRIPVEAERPFTELEEIAVRGAQSLKGVFADFLFDPFETGLDGLVVGFADAIRRMTSDALAAMLFESLFGGFQGMDGGPSGLGGIISGVFGSLPGFENGGDFTVGGSGGPDSQLVAFRASPMENISITTPGQQNNGPVEVVQPEVSVTSVNVIDTSDITAAMEGSEGDKVFMNFISRKRKAIAQQLG